MAERAAAPAPATSRRATPPTPRQRLLVGDWPFHADEMRTIAEYSGIPYEKVVELVRITTRACKEALA